MSIENMAALRDELATYCPISDRTWHALSHICCLTTFRKRELFTKSGEVPHTFGFVISGLLRAYITDGSGNEYNKIFFPEKTFPGSMVALLTNTPSAFAIEALEDSHLIEIDFKEYRNLLKQYDDLKWFQILYLEKNWVIGKEDREVSLVQNSATERYLKFKEQYEALEKRIPQFHIASHLGITPTQLSRIRKSLKNSNK